MKYYAQGDDGAITLEEKVIYLELAVYNPITNISTECADTNISYINAEFTESAMTTISFSASAKGGSTPSSSVEFSAGSIPDATAIRITATMTDDLDVSIIYLNEDITNAVMSANGYIVDKFTRQDLIIRLNRGGATGSVDIKFTALRFNVASSLVEPETINVVSVEKVKPRFQACRW